MKIEMENKNSDDNETEEDNNEMTANIRNTKSE